MQPQHALAGRLPPGQSALTGLLVGPARAPGRRRSRAVRAYSGEGEDGKRKESFETLFERELKKRGVAYDRGARDAPENKGFSIPQLDLSRNLNSEGLEGLLPRAKELLLLGLTFPFAFVPLALVVAILGGGLYAVYGDHFVHGGRAMALPRYVNPEDLLEEGPAAVFKKAREEAQAPPLADSASGETSA